MRLPQELAVAIQREVEQADQRDLLRASEELTRRYKSANFGAAAIKSDLDRAAYLLVRMPATYAAVQSVFAELQRLAPQDVVTGLLDLGAGPGTALFAAAQVFPTLHHALLIELSHAWLAQGPRLAAQMSHSVFARTQWLQRDLRVAYDLPPHDLVVMAYSLGEMPDPTAHSLLYRAWNCASKFMVVIEPGTPRGFATVHAARSALIANGAHILAPCPHDLACPMAGTRDWCHFTQRVERTSQHRRFKSGTLGYEDEKFSYVIAAKTSVRPAAARIVRHPKKLGGHVQLMLCARNGIEVQTITRSAREAYKRARQAEWGDAWENDRR